MGPDTDFADVVTKTDQLELANAAQMAKPAARGGIRTHGTLRVAHPAASRSSVLLQSFATKLLQKSSNRYN